jgi:dual 3',5'-cyclic-AMP and -GMP phosphodiesterase 11
MCSKHGKAMTLTFQQVEQWLDEHYDLAEDYFVRKATARMVKLWQEATRVRCEREKSNPGIEGSTISSVIGDKESALKAKQCHFNNSVEIFNSNECEDECEEPIPHRRLSEPHRQPTTQRQFSADERNRQLLYSKSIPSTFFQSLDLNLSTLSELKEDKVKRVKSPPRQLRKTKSLPNCGQQHVLGSLIESKVRLPSSKSLNKESKLDLKNNNEREFFFEIVRDIANDLDLKTLSYKILVNVGILTNADRCSLFIVEGPKGKQWLVSKVFDVHIGSTNSPAPKEAIDHQREIRVPFGVGLVGYAAATGETVNIPDAYAVCNSL